MKPQEYIDSLPLAERIYRKDKQSAEAIYDQSVIEYLRDGVTILPGVINIDLLDQFDRDLTNISDPGFPEAKKAAIKIDGSDDHYKAKHLLNLSTEDFRTEKPGLKLCDMHRHFDSANQLAFSSAITGFMEALFGSPAALIQSLTFWKSSEQPQHQDFSYVHHHSKLAHLAAAWIPLEDISADAGPLVYYKGSHLPDMHGFFDWGEGSILASRAVEKEIYENYRQHLIERIEQYDFKPSIFLPKRGDLLIWHGALIHGGTRMKNPKLTRKSYVCHYTSAASHAYMKQFRVGAGFDFSPPVSEAPVLIETLPLRKRIVAKAKRKLIALLA